MSDRPTSVYIIECGGFIKIGVAVNPAQRMKTLQTGLPARASIFATREFQCAKVAYEIECRLHRRFRRERTVGEWFDLEPGTARTALMRERPLVPSGRKLRSDRLAAWTSGYTEEEEHAMIDALMRPTPCFG